MNGEFEPVYGIEVNWVNCWVSENIEAVFSGSKIPITIVLSGVAQAPFVTCQIITNKLTKT